MLRVFMLISSLSMIPALGWASSSNSTSDDASTSRWIAQVDVKGAPSLKTKMDVNRRRLIDSAGLRKALKGPKGIKDGKGKGKGKKNKEEEASSSNSPKPIGPTIRVGVPKVNAKKKTEKPPKNQKYNFEFSKAEIMDVVKAISNMTKKNFRMAAS